MSRIDELTLENQKLMEQKAAIKSRQMQIAAELNSLVAEKSAKRNVASMSEAERAAVAQLLQPGGIESEEEVGQPT